ncbi:MAG: Cysteine--tRNA ligase [Parcubacteria group bacterium ADurb.Bin326]|nr:MAG: Cysteine--tRNA ligase [Parcubacteria group bacterium ADurb.Bin326]
MLKIQNTLTKKTEDFQPLEDGKVKFYQCGPTVYWVQHIGNMRAMVLADLIRRSLVYLGYEVKFVRNYTDVGHMTTDEDGGEDKMTKAAKRESLSPEQIADKYIAQFEADVKALNCLPPDYAPRATEYIRQMQEMVQYYLDNGFAYVTDLAIYFDISKAKDYTALSGQKLEMNQAEAGSGEVGDPQKKHPADFAVWFFKAGTHANALQTWSHDFKLPDGSEIKGEGFPGWHLECSAMNYALLGPTIDIHLGGIEHVPVHHTNEIAQSEAFTGKKFVDYWMHNEHLTVDGGKMSKSEGTAYSVADIVAKGYDPLVLRYFFLGAHYRSKQNFTWEALDAAKSALDNLSGQILALKSEGGVINEDFKKKFIETLESDFNLPQALSVVFEMLKADITNADKYATLLDFDKVLGLGLSELKEDEAPEQIKKLAEERWQARQNKDWSESDRLRDEITNFGWQMEDGKDDYKLKKL